MRAGRIFPGLRLRCTRLKPLQVDDNRSVYKEDIHPALAKALQIVYQLIISTLINSNLITS